MMPCLRPTSGGSDERGVEDGCEQHETLGGKIRVTLVPGQLEFWNVISLGVRSNVAEELLFSPPGTITRIIQLRRIPLFQRRGSLSETLLKGPSICRFFASDKFKSPSEYSSPWPCRAMGLQLLSVLLSFSSLTNTLCLSSGSVAFTELRSKSFTFCTLQRVGSQSFLVCCAILNNCNLPVLLKSICLITPSS